MSSVGHAEYGLVIPRPLVRGGSWFTGCGWYIWWSDQGRAGPEPGFREIGFRLALRKGERAMTPTRSEDHE